MHIEFVNNLTDFNKNDHFFDDLPQKIFRIQLLTNSFQVASWPLKGQLFAYPSCKSAFLKYC